MNKYMIYSLLSIFSFIFLIYLALNYNNKTTYTGPKFYKFKIVYSNGDIDTLDVSSNGKNMFSLKNGDIKIEYKTIISGVRYFNVLSIDTINKNNKYKPTIKL